MIFPISLKSQLKKMDYYFVNDYANAWFNGIYFLIKKYNIRKIKKNLE